MTSKTYTSVDPTPLARTLILWLWLDLAAQIPLIIATLYHVSVLQALDPEAPVSFWEGNPATEQADLLVFLGFFPAIVTLFVAGFLTLKWIYRVSRNAHSMAEGLTVRPGWSVGWFFVPFANLLMPFRGVRQAWQASVDPAGWSKVPVPSLLRWWWGLWLVFTIVDNASFRIELRAETISGVLAADYVAVMAALLRIPLDVVLIRVIRQLTQAQTSTLNQHTFS